MPNPFTLKVDEESTLPRINEILIALIEAVDYLPDDQWKDAGTSLVQTYLSANDHVHGVK